MARQMIDYTVDDNNDLLLSGGDFVRGECTVKHQTDLLLDDKGDYKMSPTICVGAFSYLDDEGVQNLSRAAAIEFASDGMTVSSIILDKKGNLNINAYYP